MDYNITEEEAYQLLENKKICNELDAEEWEHFSYQEWDGYETRFYED